MKRILFLVPVLFTYLTTHSDDISTSSYKRNIRHFLYQAVEQNMQLRLTSEQKEQYLAIMHEHLADMELKLAGTTPTRSESQEADATVTHEPSCYKVAICASCSAILIGCVTNGYSVVRGYINTLITERDRLAQEVATLKQLIANTAHTSAPAPAPVTLTDALKPVLARVFGVVVPEAVPSQAAVEPVQVTTIEVSPETPSIASAMTYTITSALAAYHTLKYTYKLATKLFHKQDHLIATIEKDKAVIAFLESSN